MISRRFEKERHEFQAEGWGPKSGHSISWRRFVYGAEYKFIAHFDHAGHRKNIAAVKIVNGRGVSSHNFRPSA